MKNYLLAYVLALSFGSFAQAEDFISVCNRSEFVKRAIEKDRRKECQNITLEDLWWVERLSIYSREAFKNNDFANLGELKELKLYYNPEQKELPETLLKGLRKLEYLLMSDMPFESIPKGFFDDTSLKRLQISRIPLKEFPTHLIDRISLHEFGLSETNLEELPEDLFNQMPSARRIDIYTSPIKRLHPKMLEKVGHQLEIFAVSYTDISSFPVEMLNTRPYQIGDVFLKGNKFSEAEKERIRASVHGNGARNLGL